MLAGNHKPASPLFAKKTRMPQAAGSGLALAALAAAPVPVAFGTDIDMDEPGFAIGADAATIGKSPDIFGECPFGYAGKPDIRRLATHVLRALGAAHPPVIGRRAIAGGDDRFLAELPLDTVQQRNQFRFQALNPDPGVLGHKSAL